MWSQAQKEDAAASAANALLIHIEIDVLRCLGVGQI
jgi:hypothetical protein